MFPVAEIGSGGGAGNSVSRLLEEKAAFAIHSPKDGRKQIKKIHFREKVFPVSCVSVDASPVSPAMNPSVDSRPSVEAVFSDYVSHLQEDQELREVKETFRVISQVPF